MTYGIIRIVPVPICAYCRSHEWNPYSILECSNFKIESVSSSPKIQFFLRPSQTWREGEGGSCIFSPSNWNDCLMVAKRSKKKTLKSEMMTWPPWCFIFPVCRQLFIFILVLPVFSTVECHPIYIATVRNSISKRRQIGHNKLQLDHVYKMIWL